MARRVDTKLIEAEIANTFGVSIEQVHLAQKSQFDTVAKVMKDGNFDSIRLRFFGRFHVLPGRLEKIRENAQRHKDKQP